MRTASQKSVPSELSNADDVIGGLSRRWDVANQEHLKTNCMGTALFLAGLRRTDGIAHISESSEVLNRCKLTHRVGPGILLSWEHHPGFSSSRKRNQMFVAHHMAVVKQITPEIEVYHRPGSERRIAVDPIEIADLLDARLFEYSGDYCVFAYKTPLFSKGRARETGHWPSCSIAEVRESLTRSRELAMK